MLDIEAYLKERRDIINAALDAEMPGEDVSPTLLHKAMRYSITGGKRLRPALCLTAAEAVGASLESALIPALAVELLHTYTLIHDDLPCMDNDDLRRGQPASHVKFGEANAVLAGDALQALAFEVLARASVPPAYPSNQLFLELSHAAGSRGVVGGQVEDIAAGNGKPGADVIEYIHLHKTADLFRAAVRMGGIAGDAGKKELEALTEYAVNLGLAFQITDDLLDSDKQDKAAYPAIYGPEGASERAETLIDKAVSAVQKIGNTRTEPLIAIARYVIERKG